MNVLTVFIIVGMLATIAVLATGIVAMARGGSFDRKHNVQLMFTRVGLQGLVLVLLLIALIAANV